MDKKAILAHVDHTLLKPQATWEQVKEIVDEGIRYATASVCIAPAHVKQAAEYAAKRVKICTVIGFPTGYSTTETKCFEAADAVKNGADEIDMVINIGWAKEGDFHRIIQEIKAVKAACNGRILKVIIETCLLTEEEKIQLCHSVSASGADYIKTSTGFSTGGATFDDVALMRKHCENTVKVKAAGGISGWEYGEKFLKMGADRLGTSRLVALKKAEEKG